MTPAKFTTVPLRCPSCGQQTHKTLASVIQNGGFACRCGVHNDVDVERFSAEITKFESGIKDFGRQG